MTLALEDKLVYHKNSPGFRGCFSFHDLTFPSTT